jgi:hypothetical protein
MTGLPRSSVYLAESTADRASSLIPGNWITEAGVARRLMDVHLSRLTPRSTRKAGRLASDLHRAAEPDSGISPLRRTQILRSLITYHRRIGDPRTATSLITECLQVTAEANLLHQRNELIRDMT